ncbi:MAG: hypothetical protein JW729_04450, partial [Bacteroidales bacterium]|nr:hypothetical protein [Bacteroidales bacterium]
LFQPEWGVYDLAIGDQLDSAYNGTIKKSQFTDSEIILPKTSRESNFISPRLNQIYKTLRSWREQKSSLPNLENLIEEIKKEDAEDWLIIYELIELANELKDQKNLHLLQRYLDTIKDKPISLLN